MDNVETSIACLPNTESRNAVSHVHPAHWRSCSRLRRDAGLGSSEQEPENEEPDETERGGMTPSSVHEHFSSYASQLCLPSGPSTSRAAVTRWLNINLHYRFIFVNWAPCDVVGRPGATPVGLARL